MKKEVIIKIHALNRIARLSIAIVLLVLVSLPSAFAQTKPIVKQYETPKIPPVESPVQNTGSLVVSPDEDYLIGPSDVIDVKIEDAPELSGIFRLSAKGTFTLPVIGTISAEKKTTEDVVNAISAKLRGGYLINPIVSVSVKQSNSRAFFIQGSVRRPGIYQIEGRPTLLKLITIAGGLSESYGSTAFVMREKKSEKDKVDDTITVSLDQPVKTDPAGVSSDDAKVSDKTGDQEPEVYETIRANINNLLRGNLDQNIVIQPGDIVHIPQSDIFFVSGEVKAPGSFPLKEGTTLRQAISLAQGTTFEGAASKGIIFRESQSGVREEIKIDVAAIMAGKNADVDILPNDIVIVPNSQKKTVAKSLLKAFASSVPALLLRTLGVF